jgi:hypothetical protein
LGIVLASEAEFVAVEVARCLDIGEVGGKVGGWWREGSATWKKVSIAVAHGVEVASEEFAREGVCEALDEDGGEVFEFGLGEVHPCRIEVGIGVGFEAGNCKVL